MAINDQAIIDAAERLLAETGRIPTVETVRDAIGGGSFSTIGPVLREWRKQHQAARAVAEEIPLRVREALERAAAGLWGAFREEVEERMTLARRQAEERMTLARRQAEERAIEAESERDQAFQEVGRLEAALVEAGQAAEQEKMTLMDELKAVRAELAGANQEIAALGERTRQQQSRIEAMTAEAGRARDDLAAAREQRREEAGRHEREMAQAHQKIEALSQKLDVEREARQNETRALEVENARLAERAAQMEELRRQVTALQDRLSAPANENRPGAPERERKKAGTPAE